MTEMETESLSVECEMCCGLELQQDYEPCSYSGVTDVPQQGSSFKTDHEPVKQSTQYARFVARKMDLHQVGLYQSDDIPLSANPAGDD